MDSKKRWQKRLYENYGLPDNYTDGSFLEELRRNVKPHNVTVMEAITLGASISIRLNVVVLFAIVFVWLNREWITPDRIFVSCVILTFLGYAVYNARVASTIYRLTKDLRTVLLFLTFGYILSPILKTLTETISTDTIYAMTILMFMVHLVFSKYGASEISLSESLSITSSIFGSLMLASRLASPLHAFSLLTVSVQCFVLLPFLMCRISNKILVSAVLTCSTMYFLVYLSQTLLFLFIIATGFLHFAGPLWYVRCQKYKDNIYGPWDEAIITS